MNERMLDKTNQPTHEEFSNYCGVSKHLFLALDQMLSDELGLLKSMRFPYGNKYGWSYKYTSKNKLMMDVFAENGSFTVMIRLLDSDFKNIYDSLSSYSKEIIDNRYPCGEGAWVHYRVLNEDNLSDLKKIILLKMQNKSDKHSV